MKKPVYIFLLLFLNIVQGFAQSTMRGKVSDENGETLIGVTLTIKSNRSIGCVTDFDGNYSLQIPDTAGQTVVVSFISYKTIEFKIHPKKGEVVLKDFVLKTASQDIKEVEIVAKSTKSKDYYMENMKKKSGEDKSTSPQAMTSQSPKESAFQALGFPSKMSYEHRSKLRKEAGRFLRFSYLVDSLHLSCLAGIYSTQISDFIKKL